MDATSINKKVISYTIDSSTNTTFEDISLIDTIRNVIGVKLLKVYAEVISNESTGKQYMIDINDFYVASVYRSNGEHLDECFAILTADINDKASDTLVINYDGYISTAYREDPYTYYCNPLLSALQRLKFGLRDAETGESVATENIKRFHIEVCIYSQFAKITMN